MQCVRHPPPPTAMTKTFSVLSAVTAFLISSVSAVIIYQDDFNGTPGEDVHNSIPDVRLSYAGASSTATWSANTIFDFATGGGAVLVAEGSTSRSAYLPFIPQTNFLYDYQISMSFTEVINASRSMQMGFFSNPTPNLTTALTSNASQGPVIFFRNAGSYVARAVGNADITGFSSSMSGANVTNLHTFRITLDTSQTQWVMRTYINGSELGSGYTFPANPNIGAVGFSVNSSMSGTGTPTLNAAGTFSNMTLSATPIPEPSHLALLSLCPLLLGLQRVRKP